MKESLRGLFYIVKGHYVKNKAPRFWNEVSASYNDIGGYDPEREDTEEWYMVYDNETFRCHGAVSTLLGAGNIIRHIILKHKTKEDYFTTLEQYEVSPSPTHLRLQQEVYNTYGDYFKQYVKDVENRAYTSIRENTPTKKARKRFIKRTPVTVEVTPVSTPTPITEDTEDLTPKKKTKGLKPRKREVMVEIS